MQDVDWFFMPLVNPDGYEFSHTDVGLLNYEVTQNAHLKKWNYIAEPIVEKKSSS